MGCHLSSCGFSSFSHPLEDLFLFWPVSTFATFFSLSHHAALAGRGGAAGDSWIVQGHVLQIGWGERRVPPSLLPPPKSNGPVSGEISHYTSWLFPYLVLAWVPHPGQLSHKWESGWEAWPSRVLRWPVSASPGISLPLHRASSSCLLSERALQVPHFNCHFLPHGAWRQPDGLSPHICPPGIFVYTRISVPTPSCSNHRRLSKDQRQVQSPGPGEVGTQEEVWPLSLSPFCPPYSPSTGRGQASCMGL